MNIIEKSIQFINKIQNKKRSQITFKFINRDWILCYFYKESRKFNTVAILNGDFLISAFGKIFIEFLAVVMLHILFKIMNEKNPY